MADKNSRRNQTTDALFDAILSLETREECYNFFEDLCTVKEISDMAQRLEAAKMLLDGRTYDQIVKAVEISTATISRINRCIQYGSGGLSAHRMWLRAFSCRAMLSTRSTTACSSVTLGRQGQGQRVVSIQFSADMIKPSFRSSGQGRCTPHSMSAGYAGVTPAF